MPATATRPSAPLAKRGPTRIPTNPPAGFLTGTKMSAGDLIQLDASGRVKHACAASARIAASITVALCKNDVAAAVVTGTLVEIENVTGQDHFRMTMCNNLLTAVWNNNLIGKPFEVANVAGVYCVDISANTNPVVVIVQLDPNVPSTDLFPGVIVRFLDDSCLM